MIINMSVAKLSFQFFELVAFILPALPESIWIRLLILFIYFVAHCFTLQYAYAKIKTKILSDYGDSNHSVE